MIFGSQNISEMIQKENSPNRITRLNHKLVVEIQPWWLSGLIHHISNSSRDRQLGSEFESPTLGNFSSSYRFL